jgi:hypothetical protein
MHKPHVLMKLSNEHFGACTMQKEK